MTAGSLIGTNMIVAVAMLMQAPAPPTLAEVARLPPAAAGDLVLSGQQHGRIEAIVKPQAGGLEAPGVTERQFVEQAVAREQGCLRKRWTARFRVVSDANADAALLENTYSTTEITLSNSPVCPQGRYVHLNPGVDPQQAFDALVQLERVRSERHKMQFTCSDDTSSGLCTNARTTRRELAAITPWAVSREGRTLIFWLGVPGRAVTEVRFDTATPDRISVTRSIPAPA